MVPLTHDAGAAGAPGAPGNERPPTMAEIGRALGLSRQAVSKAAKEGMPTHSIPAAHAWRLANLDPGRRKRGAYDAELRAREAVAKANDLMMLAGQLLEADPVTAFPALVPALQQALRAVPEAARDEVLLCFPVMTELTRPVQELIDHCERQDRAEAEAEAKAAGTLPPVPASTEMTKAEADQMGAFWYAIAAGEKALTPGPNFRP